MTPEEKFELLRDARNNMLVRKMMSRDERRNATLLERIGWLVSGYSEDRQKSRQWFLTPAGEAERVKLIDAARKVK